MIGTVEVKVASHKPQMPLCPMFAYSGSPSSLRIMDVPKSIGEWQITSVKVIVKYPNNETIAKTATRTGNVWVATIPATTSIGKVSQGYEIVADGKDESGTTTTGYVLGVGDVFVLERDSEISRMIEKNYVRYCDELPTTASKGDLMVYNGVLQIYTGTSWFKVELTDLTSYAKKTYVDEAIDEVEEKIDECVKQPVEDQYGDTLTKIGTEDSAYVGVGSYIDSMNDYHPIIRLGETTAQNIGIETTTEGGKEVNRLVIGDGGASNKINKVPVMKDIPTKTSQLTNDSDFITSSYTGNFIKWFAPDSSHPDIRYINFGSSSAGGISFVSNDEDPTQSYIDIAGNIITAPGYVPTTRGISLMSARDEEEDNHLKFNNMDLAFVDEIPTTISWNDITDKPTIPTKTSDLTNDSGFVSYSAGTQDTPPPNSPIVSRLSNGKLVNSGYTINSILTIQESIPSKTSDLTNDSGFVTSSAIESKRDKSDLNYEVEGTAHDGFLGFNVLFNGYEWKLDKWNEEKQWWQSSLEDDYNGFAVKINTLPQIMALSIDLWRVGGEFADYSVGIIWFNDYVGYRIGHDNNYNLDYTIWATPIYKDKTLTTNDDLSYSIMFNNNRFLDKKRDKTDFNVENYDTSKIWDYVVSFTAKKVGGSNQTLYKSYLSGNYNKSGWNTSVDYVAGDIDIYTNTTSGDKSKFNLGVYDGSSFNWVASDISLDGRNKVTVEGSDGNTYEITPTYSTKILLESELPQYVVQHKSEIGYASTSDVPTKVSDLTNDSGFITNDDVPTRASELDNDMDYQSGGEVDIKIENQQSVTFSGTLEDGTEFSYEVVVK